MNEIKFDYEKAKGFVSDTEMDALAPYIKVAHDTVQNKTGAGSDFLGWVDLPVNYDKEEFERILLAAEKIKAQADVLLVIGIGGSYLGAKSAIEMLKKYFGYQGVEIIFVGHQISGTYVKELIEYLADKDGTLSKFEPMINFVSENTEFPERGYCMPPTTR